jgi:multidrug resistance efflux pump
MTALAVAARRPSRMRFALLLCGAIVVAIVATLMFNRTLAARPAPVISTANGVIATAPGWVDVEGGIQRLGVRTEGTVQTLAVREGQGVAAGELLLKLDDQQTVLELRSAGIEIERHQSEQAALDAQLQRARADLTRLTPLVAEQAESADELRASSAHVGDLQAQLDMAKLAERSAMLLQQQLQQREKRLELRAPAAGEILRVMTHAGDAVAPGTPLLSFAGNGQRIVRAELDERLFGQVSAGMIAEVAPEYDDMKVYDARVLRVAHSVGPVQSLPDLRVAAKDDRVVECVLSIEGNDLLIGQRVLVRVMGGH